MWADSPQASFIAFTSSYTPANRLQGNVSRKTTLIGYTFLTGRHLLPSATKLRRLCFYTCLSFCPHGGGLPRCMLGSPPGSRPPPPGRRLPPRTVRILLECIPVLKWCIHNVPFQFALRAYCLLMTTSISAAPSLTAWRISSNRVFSGVCPAGNPVATVN